MGGEGEEAGVERGGGVGGKSWREEKFLDIFVFLKKRGDPRAERESPREGGD